MASCLPKKSPNRARSWNREAHGFLHLERTQKLWRPMRRTTGSYGLFSHEPSSTPAKCPGKPWKTKRTCWTFGVLYCFDPVWSFFLVLWRLGSRPSWTCFSLYILLRHPLHQELLVVDINAKRHTHTINSDKSAELVPDVAMGVFTARPALLLLLLLAAVWCIRGWYLHREEYTRGSYSRTYHGIRLKSPTRNNRRPECMDTLEGNLAEPCIDENCHTGILAQ